MFIFRARDTVVAVIDRFYLNYFIWMKFKQKKRNYLINVPNSKVCFISILFNLNNTENINLCCGILLLNHGIKIAFWQKLTVTEC